MHPPTQRQVSDIETLEEELKARDHGIEALSMAKEACLAKIGKLRQQRDGLGQENERLGSALQAWITTLSHARVRAHTDTPIDPLTPPPIHVHMHTSLASYH